MKFNIPFLLLLSAVILFGCTTAPIQKTSHIPQHWPLQAKRMEKILRFHLAATLGIKTENKGGAFTLDWQQNQQSYEILCLGPLGQLVGKLTGGPLLASITLNTGEQKTGDPGVLLKQVLGISIPFQELLFWIRGIPDPAFSSQLFFNEKENVAEINQVDWKISYSAWTSAPLPLPQKIMLEKETIRVKIVISSWEMTK